MRDGCGVLSVTARLVTLADVLAQVAHAFAGAEVPRDDVADVLGDMRASLDLEARRSTDPRERRALTALSRAADHLEDAWREVQS